MKKVSQLESGKSPNQYIIDIINSKIAKPVSKRDSRIQPLLKYISHWGGNQIYDIALSGSSAKGTALKGSSDLDLFISLKANTNGTLKEIFHSLLKYLGSKGIQTRPQNVSIRVLYNGLQIDLVPGKKMPNQTHWHFLYTNRRADQERIQTNINEHLNHVIGSGRINEIIALKIWRNINNLEFPSMYLEMYAIKALKGKWSGKTYLADNVHYVLEDIAKYFHSTAVYDPSNKGNVISDSIYQYQRNNIQKAAQNSINKRYWNEIIF